MGFCNLDDFFRFSKKSDFWVFLVHPTVVLVLLSASVERCFVSRMQDFFGFFPNFLNFEFLPGYELYGHKNVKIFCDILKKIIITMFLFFINKNVIPEFKFVLVYDLL